MQLACARSVDYTHSEAKGQLDLQGKSFCHSSKKHSKMQLQKVGLGPSAMSQMIPTELKAACIHAITTPQDKLAEQHAPPAPTPDGLGSIQFGSHAQVNELHFEPRGVCSSCHWITSKYDVFGLQHQATCV